MIQTAKNEHTKSRKHLFRAISAPVLLLISVGAHGQVLEEIVVTAQKREQSLQDVGISVTAFSGDELERLGYTDSLDISQMTAGVTVSGSSAGQNAQFSIRGVTQNDFSDIVEGPTAIYLDEGLVVQQNAGHFGLFDIERVEVLKGPQGTLFGRNATGGLVHYITRKPTSNFEGYTQLAYGRYNSVNVQGALSGPLTSRVNGRAAVYFDRHDPIHENTFNEFRGDNETRAAGEIDPSFSDDTVAGGGQDHWNQDTFAARLSFDIDLSDGLSLYLMGHGSRSKQGENSYQQRVSLEVLDSDGSLLDTRFGGSSTSCLRVNVSGACVDLSGQPDPSAVRPEAGGDFWGYVDPDGSGKKVSKDFAFDDSGLLEMHGANAKIEWEGQDLRIVSISDYKTFDRKLTDDVDSGPADTIVASFASDTESFTQELRLEGGGERANWIVGGYYLYADANVDNGFVISPSSLFALIVGLPIDAVNEVSLETNSYSLFAQGELDLLSDLTLTVGGRYIREKKDFALNQTFFTNGPSRIRLDHTEVVAEVPDFIGDDDPANPVQISTSDPLWSAKFGLDWRATEDLLVYASASRGVKAGSFNAPLPLFFPGGVERSALPYDEETLWAYELGFKSSVFGGSTRLNGAAFFYDYQDYQAFRFVGVAGLVSNSDAEIWGAELELQTRPYKGLDIRVSGAWFDAKVFDVEFGDVVRDVKPTFAPEYQLSGSVTYEWQALGGWASVGMDGMYKDGYYDNLSNFGASRHPSQKRLNVRASFSLPNDTTTLSAFVENVTDERNENIGFDLSGFCGCSVVGYDEPRWWGVRLRQDF